MFILVIYGYFCRSNVRGGVLLSSINDIEKMNRQIRKLSRIYNASVFSQAAAAAQSFKGIPNIDTKAMIEAAAAAQSFKGIPNIDTRAMIGAAAAAQSFKGIPNIDTKAMIGAAAVAQSFKGIPNIDTKAMIGAAAAAQSFKGISNIDTRAMIGAAALTQDLEGITKAFQNNRYNYALVMASSLFIEDLTSLENTEVTDEYYNELYEILVGWYTNLISHLQQIWSVITTDTAMEIMTVAGFIMTLVGTIIAIKGVFSNDTKLTPEINIHNYSDDLEIKTKIEGNQVDIFIHEKEIE